MLTVLPQGGLCNRMRVLDSAIQFSEDAGRSFDLVWELNSALNASWEKLFEPLPRLRKTIQISSLNRKGLFLGGLRQKFLLEPFIDRVVSNEDIVRFHNQLPLPEPGTQKERLLVRTWERFYQSRPPFGGFSPVPLLRARVEQLPLDFRVTTGVHIRRTDIEASVAKSTTDLFIRSMRTELDRDSATVFFVCSDSPAEVAKLKQVFGNRVYEHGKRSLDRMSPAAIEDAVVDLWGLSRCRKVLGSYGSSFSSTAAELGKIECETIGA